MSFQVTDIRSFLKKCFFNARQRQEIFLNSKVPRPAQRPTKLHILWVPRFFPGGKRREREPGHSYLRNVDLINEWNCTSTSSYSFIVWTRTFLDFALLSTSSLMAFYAGTPQAAQPHLHCIHRVKRFSFRTCFGRVSKIKCYSFPQYRKSGSVIGPRGVEGNLKFSKLLYIISGRFYVVTVLMCPSRRPRGLTFWRRTFFFKF